jgi:hypothetical protein
METYTPFKELVENPHYEAQRQRSLRSLEQAPIDEPIVPIVQGFARLPHCFTLQSCYGHFLYPGQNDKNNLDPLPEHGDLRVITYRIAYLAWCIQDSPPGRALLSDLAAIAELDSAYIQFGCAEWFWTRQVNSYILQVEPQRFKDQDVVQVDATEARRIEQVRGRFFEALGKLIL